MVIPRVATCCCGCSLETGSKIIGCLEVIVAVLLISLSSVSLDLLGNPSNYPDLTQNEIDLLYGVLVALIVVSVIQMIISCMLLYGVSQSKPQFISPWLIFVGIDILMTLASLIINIVVSIGVVSTASIMSTITSNALSIFMKCYFFIVVYSLFRNLKENVAVAAFARGGA